MVVHVEVGRKIWANGGTGQGRWFVRVQVCVVISRITPFPSLRV